ncbi:MAG: DUF5107 domain-containing protein [Elusimicrobia bacterium]|nr:DUF5107 domain-containing protein [Elusimicrobiota bacterium]
MKEGRARVDTSWKRYDLQVILLQNDRLRLEIFPELGAKIHRLIHLPTRTNLLWNNLRVEPRRIPIGANYDDNFCGGWDELFPNDAPCRFDGDDLPDHGELWSQPWSFETFQRDDSAGVHLWRLGASTATRMEKWITLGAGENVVHFRHKLTNLGSRELKFLWKLHPALAIGPDHRLDLPGGEVEPVHRDWSRAAGPGPYRWPMMPAKAGRPVDLRRIPPPSSGLKEFVYVRKLPEGWCALTDTKRRLGFGLVFPRRIFSSVWLFMTFGGWRGHYTAILEPCTAYPKDLETAATNGECGRLGPGRTIEADVRAVVYEGLRKVTRITRSGIVR